MARRLAKVSQKIQTELVKWDVEVWRVDTQLFEFVALNSKAQEWLIEAAGAKGYGVTITKIVVSSWSQVLQISGEMARDGLLVEPMFTGLSMEQLREDIRRNQEQAKVLVDYLKKQPSHGILPPDDEA